MAQQGKPSHHLAHRTATGTARIEHLPQEGPEGDAHAKDARPAVGALLRLGEQARRQIGAKELLQFLGRGGLGAGAREFGGVEAAKEVSGGEHKVSWERQ